MLEVQKHLLLSRELSFIRYQHEYCEYSCVNIGATYKNNWGFEIVVFLQRSDREGQRNGELCTRTGNLWYIEMSSLATTNKHISLVFKCIWKCRCIFQSNIYQENGNSDIEKDMIKKVRDWGVLHWTSLIHWDVISRNNKQMNSSTLPIPMGRHLSSTGQYHLSPRHWGPIWTPIKAGPFENDPLEGWGVDKYVLSVLRQLFHCLFIKECNVIVPGAHILNCSILTNFEWLLNKNWAGKSVGGWEKHTIMEENSNNGYYPGP